MIQAFPSGKAQLTTPPTNPHTTPPASSCDHQTAAAKPRTGPGPMQQAVPQHAKSACTPTGERPTGKIQWPAQDGLHARPPVGAHPGPLVSTLFLPPTWRQAAWAMDLLAGQCPTKCAIIFSWVKAKQVCRSSPLICRSAAWPHEPQAVAGLAGLARRAQPGHNHLARLGSASNVLSTGRTVSLVHYNRSETPVVWPH